MNEPVFGYGDFCQTCGNLKQRGASCIRCARGLNTSGSGSGTQAPITLGGLLLFIGLLLYSWFVYGK